MWFRHQHSISDVVQTSVHDNWCGSDTSTTQVMRYRHQHSISDVVQTSAEHDESVFQISVHDNWCGSDTSTRQVMWFRHQHTRDVVQTPAHKWCGSDTSTTQVMWFRHQHNTKSDVVSSFSFLKFLKILVKNLNCSTLISSVVGNKYWYLTYYVHSVG